MKTNHIRILNVCILNTFILSALLISSAPSLALEQIVRPFQSVRALGMGNVRYTKGMYEDVFFGNPASASNNPGWRVDLLNLQVEVNKGVMDNISNLSGDGSAIDKFANSAGVNNHIRIQTTMPGVYFPRFLGGRNSLAIGFFSSSQIDIDLRHNLSLDPTVITDFGPVLAFSRAFLPSEPLTIGLAAKAIYRVATNQTFSMVDYISGRSPNLTTIGNDAGYIDFDIGATYRLVGWKPLGLEFTTSFAINNLLGGTQSLGTDLISSIPGTNVPTQPRTYNAGISTGLGDLLGVLKADLIFEVTDVGNNPNGSLFRTLHLGSEVNLLKWFMVRGGINQGYFTAGLGFDFPLFKLDFATYGEEMSLNVGGLEDRRYAMKFSLAL